ncbi:MAG: hypothetical protein JRN67_05225 [Nitrososphaerota archaeon]|nr:hypothetical protein [Nitrososphaerota archaeon]
MTSEESMQKRELYCTLCEESLKIMELERHYNLNGHVGTYSPFAWMEQFVQIKTSGEYLSKKELVEKIEELEEYVDDSWFLEDEKDKPESDVMVKKKDVLGLLSQISQAKSQERTNNE